MLDIVLKILSVIGIVLLVLLIVLVVTLILILFFPITYKAFGQKCGKDIQAWLKANWLFGLLRVRFYYPEPGNVTVKLLGFTLYDSAKTKTDVTDTKDETKDTSHTETVTNDATAKIQSTSDILANVEGLSNSESSIPKEMDYKQTDISAEKKDENTGNSMDGIDGTNSREENCQQKLGIKERILAKYEKIKYTIQKIYDKIKHIWENISFYKNLLQDEQTKGLIKHAFSRIGRILKSIRPRKLKGDILFGTGSPDTTGYAFGLYGMFIPLYGKYMNVTPDFTQAILEGELYVAGHITVFQLLWHSLRLLMDKRLRLLIHRIKTHKI